MTQKYSFDLQQQIAIYIQQYGRKAVEQMLHKELINIKLQQFLAKGRGKHNPQCHL